MDRVEHHLIPELSAIVREYLEVSYHPMDQIAKSHLTLSVWSRSGGRGPISSLPFDVRRAFLWGLIGAEIKRNRKDCQ